MTWQVKESATTGRKKQKNMNAKDILNQLTTENYEQIFHALGVKEIRKNAEYWILPTLCHNLDIESASYKLYFYLNTRTTFCFTECHEYGIVDNQSLDGYIAM